jgi:acetyl-CoA C-acetyltransferase
VPIVRRGLRDGDRRRGGGQCRRRRRRLDPRHGDADRADDVRPAATRSIRRTAETKALWKEAGITDPLSEVDTAEIYVPFSWFEPMWLENLGFAAEGDGWKVTEAGETPLGGRLPVHPSGGVLSSNPIGASGMLRFSEAAKQVMGHAGEYQVDGARIALGHAYGGDSQYFSMWVVGSGKPR